MQKYQSSKPFYPLFFLYVCTTKCTFLRRLHRILTKELATWGRLAVDGRIICKQLGVTIHWIEILEEDEAKQAGTQILHQLQRPNGNNTNSLEHQFEVNYQDETLIHLVVYKSHVVPLLRLSDLSNQQTHSNVSKNKDLSITNRNITYSYQLLRSMSKDSLIPEKNMSDSNRLKRRASIS